MNTMAARVRAALALAPGAVPPRFADAYQHGGTPIWLMTGWPHAHALPAEGTRR